ncbi:endonuclease VII domain-containing protein [Rhodococcus jostii]
MGARGCRDCGAESKRPAPHPGPRCASHHREVVRERKLRAHGQRVEATYSITSEQYWALYQAQNGRCAICQRSTGASRKLSVDHDHKCCPGPTSCGKCVRCLACRPCNDMLGRMRDDVDSFRRAIRVLIDHPAQSVLNSLDIQEG